MTVRPLNLLRHPRQWSAGNAALWLWVLPGLLAGGILVGALLLVLHAQAPVWRQTLSQAHQAQAERSLQERQLQARRALQQRWQQETARNRQWQQVQQGIEQVQQALTEEAENSGLRLLQWQGEAGRMRWQGSLPMAQAWPGVRQRLQHASALDWHLQGLEQVQDSDWRVAMEALWPASAALGESGP